MRTYSKTSTLGYKRLLLWLRELPRFGSDWNIVLSFSMHASIVKMCGSFRCYLYLVSCSRVIQTPPCISSMGTTLRQIFATWGLSHSSAGHPVVVLVELPWMTPPEIFLRRWRDWGWSPSWHSSGGNPTRAHSGSIELLCYRASFRRLLQTNPFVAFVALYSPTSWKESCDALSLTLGEPGQEWRYVLLCSDNVTPLRLGMAEI